MANFPSYGDPPGFPTSPVPAVGPGGPLTDRMSPLVRLNFLRNLFGNNAFNSGIDYTQLPFNYHFQNARQPPPYLPWNLDPAAIRIHSHGMGPPAFRYGRGPQVYT